MKNPTTIRMYYFQVLEWGSVVPHWLGVHYNRIWFFSYYDATKLWYISHKFYMEMDETISFYSHKSRNYGIYHVNFTLKWMKPYHLTHTHTHTHTSHWRQLTTLGKTRILLKWQGSKQGKKRKEKEILRMMLDMHFLKQASSHDDALKWIFTSVIWPSG